MRKNILVQYHGGGYNGCFWEWNYFYVDKLGEFHDIQSSGSAGIDNMHDAEVLVIRGESHTYIYDMSKEQDIITFSRECNVVHITGVLQWFEDNPDTNVEFFAVCSACECKMTNCSEIVLEENLLLCHDCYMTGMCYCCESYVNDTEMVQVNPDEHYGDEYICVSCKEYHDEERDEENFEDLRHESFLTGKPDMFNGELRERRLSNGGGL